MKSALDDRRSTLAFLALATTVYLGNYLIVQGNLAIASTPIPEWPLALDFFVLLPVASLVLLRPTAKRALLLFVGLFSIGVLVGSFAIPPDDKSVWRHLEQIRWIYLAALIAFQLLMIAATASEIYRSQHSANVEASIEQALSKRVPESHIRRLLQADARVWVYALLRNPKRFQFPSGAFFCGKHDSNASNQQGFLWVIAAEIPVAHVLIHLYSPVVAIIVSVLSIYGFIFLLAEYRATTLRATTLEERAIHIRYGVLGDQIVPYKDICSVSPESGRPRRTKRALRFIGAGSANIRLALRPGTQLDTVLGALEVETIYIGLDEPRRFIDELRVRLGT